MESISHALWAMTVVREPSLWPAAALVANLPDFLGATPQWFFSMGEFKKAYKRGGLLEIKKTFSALPKPPDSVLTVYRSTHNLFAWGGFTLLLLLFLPSYSILSLAWLSHILVDIPTHDGEWGTRLFYPFSDFHFKGINWPHSKIVIITNFVLLLVVNVLVVLFERWG